MPRTHPWDPDLPDDLPGDVAPTEDLPPDPAREEPEPDRYEEALHL
jgi:hypothetical protein